MNISEVFHNRYELLKRIGSGGFSEVWMALDMRSGVEVAIKVFRKQDEEGIRLCREEYLKAFEMHHPNILSPMHFDVDQERPYLVMKYLHGGTLAEKLGQLSQHDIRRLIDQLSSALHYLHTKSDAIVHGDIKPDNILMDEKGNYFLTDFGVSTRLKQKFTETMVMDPFAESGKGVTPMAYRSPETFKYKNWEAGALSRKSDIWSSGVTIYQALYNQLPFNGEGGLGQLILMKSGNHTIEEILDFPDQDPYREFQPFLISALNLDPDDRPARLGEIVKPQLSREAAIIPPKKLEFVNEVKPKKEPKRLIYFLLLAFVLTAVAIGYTFIGDRKTALPGTGKSSDGLSIIEINDDTLPRAHRDIVTSVSPEIPEHNDHKPSEHNPERTGSASSPKDPVTGTMQTGAANARKGIPAGTENRELDIAESTSTGEKTGAQPEIKENTPEVIEKRPEAIPEKKTSAKTATVKPNIPIPLVLNEDISDGRKYQPGSRVAFVVGSDVVSYGEIIIRKGQEVHAIVKKSSDKKINIRFPEVYTSGGTKLKGLNLDNLEIIIGQDKKGKTFRPVTSSYQTNVLIQ